MQVVLVMIRSGGDKRSFSIARDVTVIGRREDSDFRIPLGEISRKHCRLIKDGTALRIEDLGSSNGTNVNGVRIQEAELSPGDTVQIGPVTFVVQIDGVPSEDELHAAGAAEPQGDHVPTAESPTADDDDLMAEINANAIAREASEHGAPAIAASDSVARGSHDGGDHDAADHHGDAGGNGAAEGEYDPMGVLADADASSIGSVITDDRLDDDLLIDFDQPEPPAKQA